MFFLLTDETCLASQDWVKHLTKAYNMEVILIQKEISDTFVTRFWEMFTQ